MSSAPLAVMDERMRRILDECAQLAKIGTVPVFIPKEALSDDDWGAMSEADRAECAFVYRREILQSLEGFKPQFPVIKTPQGTTLAWALPDGTFVPTFDAVILGHFPARGWWASKEITNSLPDCSSVDGLTPESGMGPKSARHPEGSPFCSDCQYNQYGTDLKGGDGKACKERMNVFMLADGHLIPWKLSIPPTGLTPYDQYVTSLVDGKPPRALASVVTRFGLAIARARKGQEYAQVSLSPARVLPYRDMTACIRVRDKFKDMMRASGFSDQPLPPDPATRPAQHQEGRPSVDDDSPPAPSDDDIPGDLRL